MKQFFENGMSHAQWGLTMYSQMKLKPINSSQILYHLFVFIEGSSSSSSDSSSDSSGSGSGSSEESESEEKSSSESSSSSGEETDSSSETEEEPVRPSRALKVSDQFELTVHSHCPTLRPIQIKCV